MFDHRFAQLAVRCTSTCRVSLLLFCAGLPHAYAITPGPQVDLQVYLIELAQPTAVEQLRGNRSKALAPESSEGKRLLAAVSRDQDAALGTLNRRLGRALLPRHRYQFAVNGFSARLSADEVELLRGLSLVHSMRPDFTRTTMTDASAPFVGADVVWASQSSANGSTGRGVVIGVIDTGIAPAHPAFANVDATGYRHTNPRGRRYGLCLSTQAQRCNDKLIGIYDFSDEGTRDGSDLDGHGTHTASTAAGGFFDAQQEAPTTSFSLRLSGIAPHANLISYKACSRGNAGSRGSCRGEWLLAALDQAVADGVDVINYSIGGAPSNAWALIDLISDERSMLNARAAGIVVAAAAGNSGPVVGSVSSPADAPWVMAVGNLSSDRSFQTVLDQLTGSTAPPKPSFQGPSISGAMPGTAAITLGERFGSSLCSRGTDTDFPPTGASNPFSTGTFNGQIVLCERGVQARLAKSRNLSLSGAAGMILINTALEGEGTVADAHFLPSIHLGQSDGSLLRQWLRNTPDARGRISASAKVRDPRLGDIMAASSARGPIQAGVLKPDLAAPGTNIFAADFQSSGSRVLSGTSMAAPHVAGAAALLRALRPDWGPDVIQSVLVLAAMPDAVRNDDGVTLANPLARGGGRLQVQRALQASLFLPLSVAQIRAGNPLRGGDPAQLNLPSLYQPKCMGECVFVRRVRALRAGSWRMETQAPAGTRIEASPSSFALAVGGEQEITIRVQVLAPELFGQTLHGEVRALQNSPDGDQIRLPLSLFADPGNLPRTLELRTDQDRGTLAVQLSGLVALPGARAELWGYVQAAEDVSLAADANDPNDAFADPAGTSTRLFTMQPGQALLATALSSGDVDLYLGFDGNANGAAEAAEQICIANGASGSETCSLEAARTGSYWLLLHNAGTLARSARLQAGVVSARADSSATLPARLPSGAIVPVALRYDLGAPAPGSRTLAWLRVFASFAASAPLPPSMVIIERSSTPDDSARLLQVGVQQQYLAPGQELTRQFFDLGAAQTAQLRLQGDAGVTWQVIPLPFPAASADATVAAAATGTASLASGNAAMSQLQSLSGSAPGRHYLRLSNAGMRAAAVSIELQLPPSPAPVPVTGAFFNPARSGHGLFLTRVGVRGQLVWYTYDAQGLPVFYLGFNDTLFAGQRGSHVLPISRFSDDGQRALGTAVGELTLTMVSPQQFQLSWKLMGRSGSEPMQWLSGGACVRELSTTALSGLWFQPERSGYGASVLLQGDQELIVSYLYDGLGEPRWLLGTTQTPGRGPIALEQYSGFCPGCTFAPVQREPVGTLTRTYPATAAHSGAGQWRIDTGFTRGLPSARWLSEGGFVLLTESAACP